MYDLFMMNSLKGAVAIPIKLEKLEVVQIYSMVILISNSIVIIVRE